MSNGKLKEIFKIGSGVAKIFVPGSVGSVLDVVNKSLSDKDDPANADAIKALAGHIEELTQAVLVLHERVKKLESK